MVASRPITIRSVEFRVAVEFVRRHHRHHQPPPGHRFSLGLYDGELLLGVVILGRPIARERDALREVEVTRLSVLPGQRNGFSRLLGAAARAARALGYER